MSLAAVWPFPNIDPVVLELPGPFALRWYGLMYLVGFGIGFLLLHRLARQGRLAIAADRVSELVGWAAVGVLVGGRLGYLLFYAPETFLHPLRVFALWEGGLSFHGGLIGTALVLVWYARKNDIPFLALGDMVVLGAPPGIAAVRIANFINGELFGRIASEGVPWAMRFPSDPVARNLLGAQGAGPEQLHRIVVRAQADGTWDRILSQIPLRHPSQLYEATLEGILLFVVLWGLVWFARRRGWRLRTGIFSGIFLIGYALARIFVEQFRQPDVQFTGPGDPLGTVLGSLTMGQVLSLLLLAGGVLILVLMALGRVPDHLADPLRAAGDGLDPAEQGEGAT